MYRLTLKVVKTDARVSDPGTPLLPDGFLPSPSKVMINAQSNLMITIGDHGVAKAAEPPQSSAFEILHFRSVGTKPSWRRSNADGNTYG